MNRIERQVAQERVLSHLHYRRDLAGGRMAIRHTEPVPGCPECASVILTLTWGMSAAWFKTGVKALFAKGQTRGVCRPVHR